jgi:hypothetical protein
MRIMAIPTGVVSRVGLVSALLAVWPSAVFADSFSLSTFGLAGYPSVLDDQIIRSSSTVTATTLSDSSSGSVAHGDVFSEQLTSADYRLRVKAAPGTLQSEAALTSVSGRAVSPVTEALSSATFDDVLTFTGGTGSAVFVPTFRLHGHGTDSTQPPGFSGPVGSSGVQLFINPFEGRTGATLFSLDATNRMVHEDFTGDPIAFTFGDPVSFGAQLSTSVAVTCAALGVGLQCLDWHNGVATSDFYSTAVLSGIRVIDSNGHPNTDFSILSASGTRYSATGVLPVPEPASVILLGSGFATVVAERRRRGNAHKHKR